MATATLDQIRARLSQLSAQTRNTATIGEIQQKLEEKSLTASVPATATEPNFLQAATPNVKLSPESLRTGRPSATTGGFETFQPPKGEEEDAKLSNFGRKIRSFGEGFNIGLADIVGLPVDAVTGVINVVGRVVLDGEDLIKNPIGGSKSIKEATLNAVQRAFPKFSPIEAQDRAERIIKRIGEEIGAAIGGAGAISGIFRGIKAGARAAQVGVPSVGRELILSASDRPLAFVAGEIVDAGVSGIGAGVARGLSDNELADVTGQLLGGITPTAIRGSKALIFSVLDKTLGRAKRAFSPEATKSIIQKTFDDAINGKPINEAIAKNMKRAEEFPVEFNATAAQTTGSPQLAAQEQQFPKEQLARQETQAKVTRQKIQDLKPQGAPTGKAVVLKVKSHAEAKVIKAQEDFDLAVKNFDDIIEKTTPSSTASIAGEALRNLKDATETKVRTALSKIFEAVDPKNTSVLKVNNIRDAANQIIADNLLNIDDIPSAIKILAGKSKGVITSLSKIRNKLARKKEITISSLAETNTAIKKAQRTKEPTGKLKDEVIRLEEIRNELGAKINSLNNDIKQLGKESVLPEELSFKDFINKEKQINRALAEVTGAAAINISGAKTKKRLLTLIQKEFQVSKDILATDPRFPDIAKKQARANSIFKRAVVERFTDVGATTISTTKGRGFTKRDEEVVATLLSEDSPQSISEFNRIFKKRKGAIKLAEDSLLSDILDPKNNIIIEGEKRINNKALQKWINKHKNTLNNFPELKKKLGNLKVAGKTLDDTFKILSGTQKNKDIATVAFILKNPTPEKIIGEIKSSNNPVEELRGVISASSDPKKVRQGLKRLLFEDFRATVKGTKKTIGGVLISDPKRISDYVSKNTPLIRELYGENGLKEMKFIGELSDIIGDTKIGAIKLPPEAENIILDSAVSALTKLRVAIVSKTIVVAETISRLYRFTFRKLTKEQQEKMFKEALFNDKIKDTLILKNIKTTKELEQRLRANLIIINRDKE